jgi:hypothetical protein
VESTTKCLLLGDVMAVLAECQNRQECGVDLWEDVQRDAGRLFPVAETDRNNVDFLPILQDMADDVSIKVAIRVPWSGVTSAFSLRRVYPPAESDKYDAASHPKFLHELIVHRMVDHRGRDNRDRENQGSRLCPHGEYEANLVAVESYEEGYLAECSHIYRLLSEV